ncbi:hypothetical protein CO731_04972 [Aminobacter sp. MSH1]|uniref:hypothetical protein n=1 Tax=Aminobacter sp. MSH1 TaxID=374606 RepID=UPI000D34EEAC|nr:hypothetical protein [Aminobacter sp. MSH1]AWC25475.1 hypothetical protein CO731_04972 [Aminobacter sp. MSH1]
MSRVEHPPIGGPSVTDEPNRYIISYCPMCETVYEASRRDQLTCSPACRVKAHRTGRLDELKRVAKFLDIHPSLALRAQATEILRPDLGRKIAAGEIDYDDILSEMDAAYNARAMQAARMVMGDAE